MFIRPRAVLLFLFACCSSLFSAAVGVRPPEALCAAAMPANQSIAKMRAKLLHRLALFPELKESFEALHSSQSYADRNTYAHRWEKFDAEMNRYELASPLVRALTAFNRQMVLGQGKRPLWKRAALWVPVSFAAAVGCFTVYRLKKKKREAARLPEFSPHQSLVQETPAEELFTPHFLPPSAEDQPSAVDGIEGGRLGLYDSAGPLGIRSTEELAALVAGEPMGLMTKTSPEEAGEGSGVGVDLGEAGVGLADMLTGDPFEGKSIAELIRLFSFERISMTKANVEFLATSQVYQGADGESEDELWYFSGCMPPLVKSEQLGLWKFAEEIDKNEHAKRWARHIKGLVDRLVQENIQLTKNLAKNEVMDARARFIDNFRVISLSLTLLGKINGKKALGEYMTNDFFNRAGYPFYHLATPLPILENVLDLLNINIKSPKTHWGAKMIIPQLRSALESPREWQVRSAMLATVKAQIWAGLKIAG